MPWIASRIACMSAGTAGPKVCVVPLVAITAAGSVDITAGSPQAHELARRHIDSLPSVPGTPAAADPGTDPSRLGAGSAELYVADERFAADYGGVREALRRTSERTSQLPNAESI